MALQVSTITSAPSTGRCSPVEVKENNVRLTSLTAQVKEKCIAVHRLHPTLPLAIAKRSAHPSKEQQGTITPFGPREVRWKNCPHTYRQ